VGNFGEKRAARGALKWANDITEVAHFFSHDPAACLKDRHARRTLRFYEHPYRYWYKWLAKSSRERVVSEHLRQRPGLDKEEIRDLLGLYEFETVEKPMVERQQIPFWNDLREQLDKLELPSGIAKRFADYLVGYLLVLGMEQEQSGSVWRSLKRSKVLKKIGVSSAVVITAALPHKEHLRTRLIALMAQDLAKRGWSQRREIYDRFVIPAWEFIQVKIPRRDSVLRQVRRSRQKHKQSLG